MAFIQFTNTLADPASTTPKTLNFSLTAKGVVLELLGTGAKYLVFQDASRTLTTVQQTLSTPDGTKFRADIAYKDAQFGIINNNNTSTIFTLVTGSGAPGSGPANRVKYVTQSVTNNGFDSQSFADFQRLWNLNG